MSAPSLPPSSRRRVVRKPSASAVPNNIPKADTVPSIRDERAPARASVASLPAPSVDDYCAAYEALEAHSELCIGGGQIITETSSAAAMLGAALGFGESRHGPIWEAVDAVADELLVLGLAPDGSFDEDFYRKTLCRIELRLRVIAETSRRFHTSAIGLIASANQVQREHADAARRAS